MSNNAGLSTVSDLVKQTNLLNDKQLASAKEGLNFAQTAIKTTRLTYTSQQAKLDQSLAKGIITKEEYDRQKRQLHQQVELDLSPWQIYVNKLTHLIDQYASKENSSAVKKRSSDSSNSRKSADLSRSASKRNRTTFSSSSSDSDTETIETKPTVTPMKKPFVAPVQKQDSTTNTEPLELSLRSPFSSTPNNIPFTAQTNYVIHRVSLQQLNEIAAQQIVRLHEEGHWVRWNDVVWRILNHFRVQDLGNLAVQRADHIPCIDHLIRMQNKINVYLDAYGFWQTLGTLGELEQDLARLFSKNDFQELLIGPIEKQTKIEDLFRLRSLRNQPIRKDLKSSDVLKYLEQFMTKEHAWKSEKEIHLDDFLKFICEQLRVKHPAQLAIRMKSIYLARNVSRTHLMSTPRVVF